MQRRLSLALAAMGVLGAIGTSDAAVVLLNASGQGTLIDPVATKVSPAHQQQPAVVTGSVWTNIRNDNFTGTAYKDQDGVTQTGVTVDWGIETLVTSNTIGWVATGTPSIYNGGAAIWTQAASNLYYSNATNTLSTPASTGALGGGTTSFNFALGVRVSGLAAGDYTIYLAGRNSGNGLAPATPQENYFYAGARAGGTADFDFSAVTMAKVTNPAVTGADTWVQGSNYEQFAVTLAGGDDLIVVTQAPWIDNGAGGSSYTGEKRAVLSMIEIVPVPEPTTGFVCAGLLAIGGLVRRR